MIDIRDFGAKCDATVSQNAATYSGTDDTSAINAALLVAGSFTTPPIGPSADWDLGDSTNMNNTGQGTVMFPFGATVLISGVLDVPPGVTVDLNGSTLFQSGASSNALQCYHRSGSDYAASSKNYIRNGTIWGRGEHVSTASGIYMFGAQGYELSDLVIGGFRVGVKEFSCQYSRKRNVLAQGNVVGNLMTGSAGAPCIDNHIDNCRFAKSAGYGMWLHYAANTGIDQIDANFCAHAALVLGAPVPDYISRVVVISNPGAGYTPGNHTLTVSDPSGTGSQFSGFAIVGSNGMVTAAYITDGVGAGTGVGSSPTATVNGSSTAPAVLVLSPPVRDSAAFSDMLLGATTSPGSGLIRLTGFKAEIQSGPGPNASLGAPDTGYLVFIDGNSSAIFYSRNFSSYARSATNYYRWIFNAGSLTDYDCEFESGDGTLANPGVPNDYGLFRNVVNGAIRFVPPHNAPTTNLFQQVISATGGVALGGQVTINATNADTNYGSHIILIGPAYGGQPALELRTYQDSFSRFVINVSGQMSFGSGASATYSTFGPNFSSNTFQASSALATPCVVFPNPETPANYFSYPAAAKDASGNALVGALYADDQYLYRITTNRHNVRIPWQIMSGDTPSSSGATGQLVLVDSNGGRWALQVSTTGALSTTPAS